ncbi:MAG: hypothetical protein AAB955_02825 [Patescibacteria group bacterium]
MFTGVAEGAPAEGVDFFGFEIGSELSDMIFNGMVITALIFISLAVIEETGKFAKHATNEYFKLLRERERNY